jgi:hypothetical protein
VGGGSIGEGKLGLAGRTTGGAERIGDWIGFPLMMSGWRAQLIRPVQSSQRPLSLGAGRRARDDMGPPHPSHTTPAARYFVERDELGLRSVTWASLAYILQY